MNIKNAIIEYMKEHNYTAIVNPEIPCGCGADDFMPCGVENCHIEECQLGYTVKKNCKVCDNPTCEGRDDEMPECYTLKKPQTTFQK